MLNNEDLLKSFNERKSITESGLDLQYQNNELNHQFYSGDAMAYAVKVTEGSRRKMVVFNRIKPFVNSIVGFMMKLRREPSYQARIPDIEQQKIASQATNAFSDYIRADSNSPQIESRQDKEMLITGIGAIEESISYVQNPYGDVVSCCLKYDEYGYDPQARAVNLLDSRWVYRRKTMNREDAASLFQADTEDFEEAESPLLTTSLKGSLRVGLDEEEDLVQVFYYQWWDYETYYRVENPLYDPTIDTLVKQELAQAFELMALDLEEENEKEDILDDLFVFKPDVQELIVTPKIRNVLAGLFEQYGIEIEEIKHKRQVFYTAIISGKKVFQKFKSKDQNGFTIKFKTGDYDEVRGIWHGIVDQLREPSRYANKALTEILYVIASNSKGGVMYEIDAVQDPKRFEQQWASTDAAVCVNSGALGQGKIQPKAMSALPSGYENVLAAAKSGMFEVSGINPEFLGSSENKQVSALLESQRIEQVTSTLATYFDSITLFQKEIGRLNLTFMRVLYENNPQRLVPVLGEDGVKVWSEISKSALFAEYDVDIQEVPITPVQKRENLNMMLSVAQNMLMAGQNIYPELIEELPISALLKERLKAKFNPELTPEQVAAQQQEQQIALQYKMLELKGQSAEVVKREVEAEKLKADIAKTVVDMDNTRASTTKIIEEAEKLDIENDQLALAKLNQISFTI
jgi:hypothetical protein